MDFRGHPLKIHIIGPVHPFRGGIAHYVTSLYKALRETQEVKILSYKRQFPAFLYPGSSDQDPSKEVKIVDADFILDPLNPITWTRANAEILKWQPDVVLFNWWVPYWALAYRSIGRNLNKRGISVGFINHNVLPHERHWWDMPLTKLALAIGDVHVVHTQAQANILQQFISIEKVLITPLPIYDPIPLERLDEKAARKKLSLPEDPFIFLFFGIVRKYKGLHILIEALSILKGRGYSPHIIIAGEFWDDKDIYIRMIDDLELESQFHIFDEYIPNEELSLYFSAANAFVAPYIGGTQSGPLTLALGFGLQAIATENISSAINYAQGDLLNTIPEDDPKSLAEQMIKVHDNPRSSSSFHPPGAGTWRYLANEILLAFDQGKSEA
jgi:glycosyltransferase involved in cell wall biosynthesis